MVTTQKYKGKKRWMHKTTWMTFKHYAEKKEKENEKRHSEIKGERHLMTEMDVGVMQLQAKEQQGVMAITRR